LKYIFLWMMRWKCFRWYFPCCNHC